MHIYRITYRALECGCHTLGHVTPAPSRNIVLIYQCSTQCGISTILHAMVRRLYFLLYSVYYIMF